MSPTPSIKRIKEFNAATKGVHNYKLGQAFNTFTPGINWCGSTKSSLREAWVDGASIFGRESSKLNKRPISDLIEAIKQVSKK